MRSEILGTFCVTNIIKFLEHFKTPFRSTINTTTGDFKFCLPPFAFPFLPPPPPPPPPRHPHKYHQNHSNRAVAIERSQHFQQKWVWLQSVHRRMGHYTIVLPTSAPRKRAGYSEIIYLDRTSKEHNVDILLTWKMQMRWRSFLVANFGFIRLAWPCFDDSVDICDLKWRLKCPRNFRPLGCYHLCIPFSLDLPVLVRATLFWHNRF